MTSGVVAARSSPSLAKRRSFWRRLFGLRRPSQEELSLKACPHPSVVGVDAGPQATPGARAESGDPAEAADGHASAVAQPGDPAPEGRVRTLALEEAGSERRDDDDSRSVTSRPQSPARSEHSTESRQVRRLPKIDFVKVKAAFQDQIEKFCVPAGLTFVKCLGLGAYGMVAEFQNESTRDTVAVKKVGDLFNDLNDAKRILREVRLLRVCDHPNVIKLLDLYTPVQTNFDDIYIVTERMDMDMEKVIRSSASLSEEHQRWFIFQVLQGVNYLHTAGVVHRDLKPGNLLVNKDCSVKICDFGLARGFTPEAQADGGGSSASSEPAGSALTEYVVTRWYRAPEVALLASQYGSGIDIWAVGCILGELISRSPLFPGSNYMDQLRRIFSIIGGPSGDDTEWLSKSSTSAQKFVARFASLPKIPWEEVYPEASPGLLEALGAMLRLNPQKRPSAKEAILLPVFWDCYTEGDEVGAGFVMDWSFDDFKLTRYELQRRLHDECFKCPTFGNAPEHVARSFFGIRSKTVAC